MPTTRGGLSYLAIATIFVVVMGGMWAGNQYAEGELLDRESPTELEDQLRVALWEAVTGDAEAAGRDTSVRVTAQHTATELATAEHFASASAVGTDGSLPDSVEKTKGLCTRTAVKLTVTDPGWNADGRTVPEPVAREVAERANRMLAERGLRTDFVRAVDSERGIGVAVRGDTVFAVFRTCNLGY